MLDVTANVNLLAERVHERLAEQDRLLLAIAGAPGSGKSTLAAELARRLCLQKVPALVVPMDGFHLDNAILDARGLRARKGSPETFDAAGFAHIVWRLSRGEPEVVVPVFDRSRDIAIAGALAVPSSCPVIVFEGNYLLFDETPWSGLTDLWDISVRLDVPLAEIRGRLIQRWLSHGLSRAAATNRAESNDVPNARRIQEKALPADIVLSQAAATG